MKELVLGQINEILKIVLEGLKTGTTVASQQLPLLLQEIVKFGIAKGIVGIILGSLIIIIGIILFIMIRKECEKSRSSADGFDYFALISCLGTGIATIVCHTYLFCMAYFAPRFYLFTQLKQLLGN